MPTGAGLDASACLDASKGHSPSPDQPRASSGFR